MKITLIHGRYFNSWEALGLGYIGAYLRSHLPGVELNFFQGCFDSDDEIIAGSVNSDIVAFSCTAPTLGSSRAIAGAVKQRDPGIWTVVGGYHCSADPRPLPEFDCIVVGEGEAAMLDIARGRRVPLVYGRPMSFQELPWPDRYLIRNERNIRVACEDNGIRITSFQSHRACPFQCKYCLDGFNKVLYPNARKAPMRYRDPADIVAELADATRTWRLDLVKFSDPTWNTDIRWVREFCAEKVRQRVGVPFYPNIHATLTSPEMMNDMRRAGCTQIAVGVESGSPKILRQIGKGTTVSSIRNCIRWAKDAGIAVRAYFILGMPEETVADLELTEQFADELDVDEYGFTILCPYPGTQMYDPRVHEPLLSHMTDEYSNDFWATNSVSNAELRQWQRRLTAKFADRLTWHNRAVQDHSTVSAGEPYCVTY
ncbi:MAG: B12-binding domain-containing radical SAM protein [Bryobacterales bacterium]|nr:B12-binding domain-containing radical SAM protein [Bryobacterales bacterium]